MVPPFYLIHGVSTLINLWAVILTLFTFLQYIKLINYFTEVIIQFPPPPSQIYLHVAPSFVSEKKYSTQEPFRTVTCVPSFPFDPWLCLTSQYLSFLTWKMIKLQSKLNVIMNIKVIFKILKSLYTQTVKLRGDENLIIPFWLFF